MTKPLRAINIYTVAMSALLLACLLTAAALAIARRPDSLDVNGVDGITVAAGAVPALAASIAKVTADPALARRLGQSAAQRWRGRYDIRVVADRYRALFERLLNERVAVQRL